MTLAGKATLAIKGIGSLDPELATVLRYGYLSRSLVKPLNESGAVGNVYGLYFDIDGQPACAVFCQKIIRISRESLLSIPNRLGIAGGLDKVSPIIGAVRGGYVNILVTDNLTAQSLIDAVN